MLPQKNDSSDNFSAFQYWGGCTIPQDEDILDSNDLGLRVAFLRCLVLAWCLGGGYRQVLGEMRV